ncbi:TPA: DUF58 domain-containing protein [Candidatus Woesearchaeota archaeon]|nr:DUF58 domain-containing protein [Candidatus Woesearchaeota archaeon]HIH31771.1 DUF58 domain-containing protein [Candidatus Woesearchaeota archaeon]HIH54668.1 DUF58 domain-containing protein [Candidatus Woesearchaeota archaeon]HIJ01555.1 DUF58 domain-containing protein [Candidatus Woesearchaeota archaeon]HIJ13958.1 DUF58 domain-containing protein [Candidatus Woesearchaeota archaeon]
MAIERLDADLLPKIRKLDVYARQSALSDVIEGNWTTTFKGHGMEFSGYRSYQYGDDASLIDWKASLRSKSLLIKEFEEEKTVNVYFMLDVSNSMLFGSTKKFKAEYAAEIVSSLAFAILRSGDSVGLSLFNEKLVTRLPLNVGKKMHYMIVKDLSNVNNYGGNFNLGKSLNLLFSVIKGRSVVIIVSDFLGLDEKWFKYLRIASQKYEVIGIMIRDPRDRELPAESGQYLLEDPYTGETLYVDVKQYAKAYKEFVEKEEKEIEKHFKATRSDLLKLTTNMDFAKEVIKFFRRRALTHR